MLTSFENESFSKNSQTRGPTAQTNDTTSKVRSYSEINEVDRKVGNISQNCWKRSE